MAFPPPFLFVLWPSPRRNLRALEKLDKIRVRSGDIGEERAGALPTPAKFVGSAGSLLHALLSRTLLSHCCIPTMLHHRSLFIPEDARDSILNPCCGSAGRL